MKMSGNHDTFPAYEVMVNGDLEYEFMPTDKGPGPMNLGAPYPGKNFSVDKVWLKSLYP